MFNAKLFSKKNKQFSLFSFGQLCLLTKIEFFFSNPSTNYLSWEFWVEKDYLTSVDDFSEMRTQLKNRDVNPNYTLSALSRGIVGLAQVPADVLCHFFPRGWCGLFWHRFQTPRMPLPRNADRCRLPPGRPGGGSGGPYRKFRCLRPLCKQGPVTRRSRVAGI